MIAPFPVHGRDWINALSSLSNRRPVVASAGGLPVRAATDAASLFLRVLRSHIAHPEAFFLQPQARGWRAKLHGNGWLFLAPPGPVLHRRACNREREADCRPS